ncbi:MAG: aminoacyl-tRNA hydrolase [Oligoflexia bacterium]|nr:aminoacyl-tRNA hydrolase [Oligoflexia bacterium]
MIELVVGLGNPGLEYECTRHNIGEMLIEALPFAEDLSWQKKFKGLYTSHNIKVKTLNANKKIHFIKPLTYMNRSGECVLAIKDFFQIEVQNILVLHDELDLPFGQVGFKSGGGLAGHNGLRSIATLTSSNDFHRLRIGISRPARGDVSNWVLSSFSKEEEKSLELYLTNAAKAIMLCLEEGIGKASSFYNKKNLIEI